MKKDKILVFSEDPAVISPLKESYDASVCSSPASLRKMKEENPGAFVVIDGDMKEGGLSLYREIKKLFPDTAAIMLSSSVTIPQAVEAAKLGVSDFLKKPAPKEKLLASVRNNLLPESTVHIRADISREVPWLAGGSGRVKSFLRSMEAAIKEKKNILFISEAGMDILSLVGMIREYSGKDQQFKTIDILPFQKENVENIFWGVLQEALAGSDMVYFSNFGSADAKHRESFLDYIKKRAPKGRVRVIASLNEAAAEEEKGEWEKIAVPALRSRKEDIPQILEAYLDKYCAKYGKKVRSINLDVLGFLMKYNWPGNYRELETVTENAVLMCAGEAITIKEIQVGGKMFLEGVMYGSPENLLEFKKGVEESIIDIYCQKTGSKEAAAELLDIPRSKV